MVHRTTLQVPTDEERTFLDAHVQSIEAEEWIRIQPFLSLSISQDEIDTYDLSSQQMLLQLCFLQGRTQSCEDSET